MAMPSAPRALSRRRRWLDLEPPPGIAMVLVLALTGLMGLLDHLTGPYIASASLYLVPVTLAAWYIGRSAGLVIAVVSTAVGFLAGTATESEVTTALLAVNQLLRLAVYVFVAVVVSAERSAMATLHELATTDPLTRLLNRRHFYERADAELRRARRDATPVAVVYLDLDDLKARNDTYGHEAGDEMLAAFATEAKATLRASDLAARVGGDEFCFLLPATDLDEAEAAVERLRRRLRATEPLPVRCSVGVVAGEVPDGLDVEAVVRAADLLMLEAKSSGKDRTVGRPSLAAV